MFKKRIYLDYASQTPVDARVLREMKRYSSDAYANPSSLYKEGVSAKKALEDGRARVAGFIHAHADEVVFTSGGTEANGLALEGAGRAAYRAGLAPQAGKDKIHLIISAIEHSSVMECAAMMERQGVEVTRLPVDAHGLVSPDDLKKAIKPSTYMVSIMTVNNETGSLQPIREIAKIIRHARTRKREQSPDLQSNEGRSAVAERVRDVYPLFHTDAAQAALYEDLNMEKLGIDLMTLDGGKAYGPRGIGCLYVRRGVPIEQIIYGGGQERGLRSGTENIPAIMGLAKALDIAGAEREKETGRIVELRDLFLAGLREIAPAVKVNAASMGPSGDIYKSGDIRKSVKEVDAFAYAPHILNVSIPGIDNEFFVLQLDAKGVACSTKSSCLRDEDESYVLKAMGADSKTSVRFSFGRWTEKDDVKRALAIIKAILRRS